MHGCCIDMRAVIEIRRPAQILDLNGFHVIAELRQETDDISYGMSECLHVLAMYLAKDWRTLLFQHSLGIPEDEQFAAFTVQIDKIHLWHVVGEKKIRKRDGLRLDFFRILNRCYTASFAMLIERQGARQVA